MSNNHFGFDASAWRALTPAQQGAQIRLLAQCEHRARSRAMLEAALALRAVRLAKRTIHSLWMRCWRRLQRRRDLAELASMDDRTLRDMGLSRMDVRAAIREGKDLSR